MLQNTFTRQAPKARELNSGLSRKVYHVSMKATPIFNWNSSWRDESGLGYSCGAASTKCSSNLCRRAQIIVIGETPDGLNINLNVGSTHPEALQEVVKSQSAIGFCADENSRHLLVLSMKMATSSMVIRSCTSSGNTFLKKASWLKYHRDNGYV